MKTFVVLALFTFSQMMFADEKAVPEKPAANLKSDAQKSKDKDWEGCDGKKEGDACHVKQHAGTRYGHCKKGYCQ